VQPTLLAEMFLVEAEGISLCLRVLEPGRSVSVLVASMECVLQAASNPEEFVRELVADQVLEHEGGGKAPRYRWHLGCILLTMTATWSLRTGWLDPTEAECHDGRGVQGGLPRRAGLRADHVDPAPCSGAM